MDSKDTVASKAARATGKDLRHIPIGDGHSQRCERCDIRMGDWHDKPCKAFPHAVSSLALREFAAAALYGLARLVLAEEMDGFTSVEDVLARAKMVERKLERARQYMRTLPLHESEFAFMAREVDEYLKDK